MKTITPRMMRMGFKHLAKVKECRGCGETIAPPPAGEKWLITWVIDTETGKMGVELLCPDCFAKDLSAFSLTEVH